MIVADGGVNGTAAIRYKNRDYSNHGIGQNLDSRCLKQSVAEFYEIELYFRLEDDVGPVVCDPFSGSTSDRCPYVSFEQTSYVNETLRTRSRNEMAKTVVPNNVGTMSLVHGVFRVTQSIESYERTFMVLEKANELFDMIVDDVSVKQLTGKCNEELVRNGNFDTNSRYWDSLFSAHFDINTLGVNKSIRVFNKGSPSDGIRQDLFIESGCLKVGDRYEITGTSC